MAWDNDNLIGKAEAYAQVEEKGIHWLLSIGRQMFGYFLESRATACSYLGTPQRYSAFLLLFLSFYCWEWCCMKWNRMNASDKLGSAAVVVSPPSHLPISLSTCWMAWKKREKSVTLCQHCSAVANVGELSVVSAKSPFESVHVSNTFLINLMYCRHEE